jgi:hypothetical protein
VTRKDVLLPAPRIVQDHKNPAGKRNLKINLITRRRAQSEDQFDHQPASAV